MPASAATVSLPTPPNIPLPFPTLSALNTVPTASLPATEIILVKPPVAMIIHVVLKTQPESIQPVQQLKAQLAQQVLLVQMQLRIPDWVVQPVPVLLRAVRR